MTAETATTTSPTDASSRSRRRRRAALERRVTRRRGRPRRRVAGARRQQSTSAIASGRRAGSTTSGSQPKREADAHQWPPIHEPGDRQQQQHQVVVRRNGETNWLASDGHDEGARPIARRRGDHDDGHEPQRGTPSWSARPATAPAGRAGSATAPRLRLCGDRSLMSGAGHGGSSHVLRRRRPRRQIGRRSAIEPGRPRSSSADVRHGAVERAT